MHSRDAAKRDAMHSPQTAAFEALVPGKRAIAKKRERRTRPSRLRPSAMKPGEATRSIRLWLVIAGITSERKWTLKLAVSKLIKSIRGIDKAWTLDFQSVAPGRAARSSDLINLLIVLTAMLQSHDTSSSCLLLNVTSSREQMQQSARKIARRETWRDGIPSKEFSPS